MVYEGKYDAVYGNPFKGEAKESEGGVSFELTYSAECKAKRKRAHLLEIIRWHSFLASLMVVPCGLFSSQDCFVNLCVA